jgi:hypothetical protein
MEKVLWVSSDPDEHRQPVQDTGDTENTQPYYTVTGNLVQGNAEEKNTDVDREEASGFPCSPVEQGSCYLHTLDWSVHEFAAVVVPVECAGSYLSYSILAC